MAGIVQGQLAGAQLAGATIYLLSEEYARDFGRPGLSGGLRLDLDDPSEASEISVMAAVEHSLEQNGMKVAASTSRSQLGRALGGQLFILIFISITLSAMMARSGSLNSSVQWRPACSNDSES